MSGGAEFTTEVAGARRVDVQGQGGSERQEVDEGLFLDGTSKKAKLRLALHKAHTLSAANWPSVVPKSAPLGLSLNESHIIRLSTLARGARECHKLRGGAAGGP